MKVGIYNRWLPTYGGGERHSLAIAAHLAELHDVEYVCHVRVDRAKVSERVDMDLQRVRFRAIPQKDAAELGPLAQEYDLFVNASHGDFIPPLARRNAMLVFFPARPQSGLWQRMRRKLADLINFLGMQIRPVDGVFGPEQEGSVVAFGLAADAQFLLPASPFRPLRVRLLLSSAVSSVTGALIELDGVRIHSLTLPQPGQYAEATVSVPPGRDRILGIHALGNSKDPGICLRIVPPCVDSARAALYDYAFHQLWTESGARLENMLPADLTRVAKQYDLLWANSHYTQLWIRAYWGLPSTVLYPPVDVDRFTPGSKRRTILSVGRFFAGSHNKKHLAMVDAFRSLCERGLTGWELHLAGSVTPGQRHREYLGEVRQAARGVPICIHADAAQTDLLELYATSAVYWHAAGFGESPTAEPEKFEHFGISVVEAMAAGCAPVVVGRGGLTELIRHGRDGYLWYTTDELRAYTKQLAADARLRSRIAQAAIISSRRFTVSSFASRLHNSLSPLIRQ